MNVPNTEQLSIINKFIKHFNYDFYEFFPEIFSYPTLLKSDIKMEKDPVTGINFPVFINANYFRSPNHEVIGEKIFNFICYLKSQYDLNIGEGKPSGNEKKYIADLIKSQTGEDYSNWLFYVNSCEFPCLELMVTLSSLDSKVKDKEVKISTRDYLRFFNKEIGVVKWDNLL